MIDKGYVVLVERNGATKAVFGTFSQQRSAEAKAATINSRLSKDEGLRARVLPLYYATTGSSTIARAARDKS